jgi:hypothetical protein
MNADILKPILAEVAAMFPGRAMKVQLSLESKTDGTIEESHNKYQALCRVDSCEIFGWGETTEAALQSAKEQFDAAFTPEKLARKAAADELRAKANAIELGAEPIAKTEQPDSV